MINAKSTQLYVLTLGVILSAIILEVSAFSPILPTRKSSHQYHSHTHVPVQYNGRNDKLHLFRRVFGSKNDDDDEKTSETASDEKETESVPFFARLTKRRWRSSSSTTDTKSITTSKMTSSLQTDTDVASTAIATPPPPPEEKKKELTPLEKALAMKAQAARTRLEAEKMDIMLTLEKIENLEKQINTKTVSEDPDLEEDLRKQIKTLKLKLEGDTKKKENESETDSTVAPKKDLDTVLSAVVGEARSVEVDDTLSSEEIEEMVKKFEAAPKFMQKIVAQGVGMDIENLNTTALTLKIYEDGKQFDAERGIAPLSDVPEFSQEQIDEVIDAIQLVPQFIKNLYGDDMKNNDTALALMMLEEEWRDGKLTVMPEITQKMIDDKLVEYSWVPQFLRGDNDTELAIELIKSDFRRNGATPMKLPSPVFEEEIESSTKSKDEDSEEGSGTGLFGGLFGGDKPKSDQEQMVESLFPESTRKEGEEINEGQAILFMSEVLAKDNVWAASGPPEKTSGGYLVRGSTRYESGAELIEAIDKNLEKSRLRNQVNCFYVFDPTPVTEEQMNDGDRPPILFITGANVARDPQPIQRTLISSVAFGTIWYNSLLPYLLNDKYMKMADEQLALADASMPSNVDFLNDLSFPLFAATVGIQAVHEIAHIIAAKSNDMNITIPTLVPSIGTGLEGGITSLQSPPKDKQALFDFAIAGPLAGMAASSVLLCLGMAATVNLDATAYSSLPGLPLNLLRQSSLIGGIIDSFSPGLLTVPDAALGSKALQEINIPLHPLAIAGYFGMMINAANLLPVGRTDGGRIGLTLFGRSGAQLVSFITLIFLFAQGITGSDLLLFFFSFVIFFQSELEIPQRNEVDDMDFSRVLLATATGVLVLLTLIPM